MFALALTKKGIAVISKPTVQNHLLNAIPDEDFLALHDHLEPLDLPKTFSLVKTGEPIDHVYFLESGIGSIVYRTPEGQSAETGIFGREGFAPTTAAAGIDRSPCDVFMQVGGSGFRIESQLFRAVIEHSPAIRRIVLLYTYLLSVQTAYTALSNAVHHVDERLARWLLMCHDRWDGDEMPITHEFVSTMLAVRRPSVTTALHVLEGNQLIRSERGLVIIRDRAALQEFAADAYGAPEAEYRRLLGAVG